MHNSLGVLKSDALKPVRFDILTAVFQRFQLFWDVTLCSWVSSSQCYIGRQCLHLQWSRSPWLLRGSHCFEATAIFKILGTTNPATQCHIIKDLNPKQNLFMMKLSGILTFYSFEQICLQNKSKFTNLGCIQTVYIFSSLFPFFLHCLSLFFG